MRCSSALVVLPGALLVAAAIALGDDGQASGSGSNHWSFQPRSQPQVPNVNDPADRAWVQTAIDAFVLKRLKQAGLRPAPEADCRTLIRRLYFDLTGLPPTPAAVSRFVADQSSDAYEKLVDRLLSSPRYGERWGQHWLDVVRFAETEGFEYDRHRPEAWRYRDYVIESFNEDKSYDRFVMEQLAGDEIEPGKVESQIAAGFHRLGPVRRNAGNAEVAFSRNEVLTEMTDIIGTALLGVSLGCARCHDHKFDPIEQKDYYRLQAFLAASHEYEMPLASPQDQRRWNRRTEELNKEIKLIKDSLGGLEGKAKTELQVKLKDLESQLPPPLPSVFSVRNIEAQRTPIHVLLRGDTDNKAERVGMRLIGWGVRHETPELPADTKNPKTILGQWITDPNHPLTARVFANRIWLYHFGSGLVSTPNDFGANGARPNHPELLDYLANTFVENGWRLKAMHRLICTSSTYRQSSRSPVAQLGRNRDPENRLWWHWSRRRLEAEEVRDAMLAVSGKLNLKAGGPSVIVPVDPELVDLLYKPTQWAVTGDQQEHLRRSIYLIAKRNLRLPLLEMFDQPDLQTSCQERVSSTHAPQALELLNGTLSNELAGAFAQRLVREAGPDRLDQVRQAFLLAAGRAPSEREEQLAVAFLKDYSLREFALAVFNLNAFLYVN